MTFKNQKQFSHLFANLRAKTTVFVVILAIHANTMFFCSELATTRPTKELKAFFAFAECLLTSATLGVVQVRKSFMVMCGSPK